MLSKKSLKYESTTIESVTSAVQRKAKRNFKSRVYIKEMSDLKLRFNAAMASAVALNKKNLPGIYSVSREGFKYITTKKMRNFFRPATAVATGKLTLARHRMACKRLPFEIIRFCPLFSIGYS